MGTSQLDKVCVDFLADLERAVGVAPTLIGDFDRGGRLTHQQQQDGNKPFRTSES